jgi:hypothetical protein
MLQAILWANKVFADLSWALQITQVNDELIFHEVSKRHECQTFALLTRLTVNNNNQLN